MKAWLACFALVGAGIATAASDGGETSPRDIFFARLMSLCGQAFEGRVVSPPAVADRVLADQRLVMHVRDCDADRGEIRIPFQIGDDRSRTWVIGRHPGFRHPFLLLPSLRLMHDHRRPDGSEDRLSRYGGVTRDAGTAEQQAFPADRHSQSLFRGANLPEAAANVWTLELHPGRSFAYQLRRPGRYLRIEFDLSRPVPPAEPRR